MKETQDAERFLWTIHSFSEIFWSVYYVPGPFPSWQLLAVDALDPVRNQLGLDFVIE